MQVVEQGVIDVEIVGDHVEVTFDDGAVADFDAELLASVKKDGSHSSVLEAVLDLADHVKTAHTKQP